MNTCSIFIQIKSYFNFQLKILFEIVLWFREAEFLPQEQKQTLKRCK